MEGTEDVKTLRAVARRQGRTLTWLARAMGFSYSYVTKVSVGTVRPSDEFLRRASEVLGEEVTR